MSILSISKSERAILNSVSGGKYYFVACMALCIVYNNFKTVYIHCFIPHIIRYRIFCFFSKLTVLDRYKDIKIPFDLKKDLSACIKFLFIVHVHLHKQIVYI